MDKKPIKKYQPQDFLPVQGYFVATVETKTEEVTSTQEDLAVEAKAEAATETDFNMPSDAQAHNDSGEGSEDQSDYVDTKLNSNFNFKPSEPFGGGAS